MEYEDHVTSAACLEDDINNDTLVSIIDTVMTSENSIESELNEPSVDSLLRFADRIVKDATAEAKRIIQDEMNATLTTTLHSVVDETLSPLELEEVNGPGDMIDIFIKHLERKESRHSTHEPCLKTFDILDPSSSDKDKVEENSLAMYMEFNPDQIETSSVDENSRQSPPEGTLPIPDSIDKEVECDAFFFGCSGDEICCYTPANEQLEATIQVGNEDVDGKIFKDVVKSESSQSVASEDVADLLAYGEMLKEEQNLAADISQHDLEEIKFIPDQFTAIEYDESFAVENTNNTIDSGDETQDESGNSNVRDSRFEIGGLNLTSEKCSCESKSNENSLFERKANNRSDFEQFLFPSKYEVSFDETSLSFDLDNAEKEFHTTRLNQTDDGSFRSYSTIELLQPSIEKTSPSYSKLSPPEKDYFSNVLPVVPPPRLKKHYRSRSLSPKRRNNQSKVTSLRSASVGKDIFTTQDSLSRKLPLSIPDIEYTRYSSDVERFSSLHGRNFSLHSDPPKPTVKEIGKTAAEYTVPSQDKLKRVPPPVLPRPKMTYSSTNFDAEKGRDDPSIKYNYHTENGNLKKELNKLRQEYASLERQIKVCE